jgi:hypothetical protein
MDGVIGVYGWLLILTARLSALLTRRHPTCLLLYRLWQCVGGTSGCAWASGEPNYAGAGTAMGSGQLDILTGPALRDLVSSSTAFSYVTCLAAMMCREDPLFHFAELFLLWGCVCV